MELYDNDVYLGAGLAAVFALLLMVFLPRLMGADVKPLSETPGYFYWLAPLLAAITAGLLQLVDNGNQLTIITWSIVAGIGAVATLTDFKDHRVPNILAYNHFVLVIVAVLANAFVNNEVGNLVWAGVALGGAAILTFLGVTLLKVGVGDFKYIPVIAAALGFISPWLALGWIITAYLLNFVFVIIAFVFHNTEKNGPRSKAMAPMIPPFYFALWALVPVISWGMIQALA
jgi:Flp pilus assembly protein protease CpaA